jgi:adhesin/invasin
MAAVSVAGLIVPAEAAIRLRLSDTVVGPVVIAQGAAANAREIEVFAAGDDGLNALRTGGPDRLNLTLTSTATWVRATAGNLRRCFGRERECIPLSLAFSTQQLQPGRYTATVRVADPNALDAPQNVLVIVQIGTPAPSAVNLYTPPNGSTDSFEFHTNAPLSVAPSTQSGGTWLSLTQHSQTSFDFVIPYRINARHPEGLAEGTYRGTVPIPNNPVAVTYQVTSNPIADASQRRLRFRLAQNSTKLSRTLRVFNRGRGTLSFTGATATVASGGNWLTAAKVENANFVTVTVDAANVNPGVYTGTVALAGNAVNNPFNIPVELEVVAQAPPSIDYLGVLENADFLEGDVIAGGGIVAIKGEQLFYGEPKLGSQPVAPPDFDGVKVFVNDQPAPVYFISYNQVNAQIPYDVRRGEGVIRIERGPARGNSVTARFVPASPKFLKLRLRDAGINIPEARDYFAIAFNQDGTLSLPRDLNFPNSRPSKRGETIVMYGFGFGQTSPASVAGQPAPATDLRPVASGLKRVLFGALALNSGAIQEASYIGLIPGFFGVYQMNVVVPDDSVSGDVPVRVQFDTVASEYALVAVE